MFIKYFFSSKHKVKLVTIVEGDQKAPFFNSYYTEVEGRVQHLSLYCSTFTLDTYFISLSIKKRGIKYDTSVWRDLGLNPGFPDHLRTLYPTSANELAKETKMDRNVNYNYTHTHTRTQCIYTYISSSSCRAASTDIPDPISPLFPVIHRLWKVFRATPRILT